MPTTPATAMQEELPDWQAELAAAYTRVPDLLADLDLLGQAQALAPDTMQAFPLRVTRSFAGRMRRGDPDDPLLRQVLPVQAERLEAPGFVADPVGDLASLRAPGLLQKYQGRALLIATGACAIHCRYCFRREFPYAQHAVSAASLEDSLDDLATDAGLSEIILSGGDPLVLGDGRLKRLLARLGELQTLRRLRIHTRVPVVLPSRITGGLTKLLADWQKPLVVVLHCNHANEIDASVNAAIRRLQGTGATLLNQSVLLRGVNDSLTALRELSEALFQAGVLPYYLHQLDPVRGAAHFEVSDARAGELLTGLAAELPGYLVPRLVREVAGAAAKQPLAIASANPTAPVDE